jgi:hypothetical protein
MERDEDEGRLPGDGGAGDAEGAGAEAPGLVAGPDGEFVALGRVQANKHRELQVARTGNRKYFDEAAKAVFLEWFAATCNLSMSAAQAGFNYKTVSKHVLKDPAFAAEVDAAMRLGVMRLKAKSLETKAPPVIGPEGELDAPDIEIGREEAMRLVREHERTLQLGRKKGRTPRVASNAEVEAALVKRLQAYQARVRALRDGGSTGSPPPQDERVRALRDGGSTGSPPPQDERVGDGGSTGSPPPQDERVPDGSSAPAASQPAPPPPSNEGEE